MNRAAISIDGGYLDKVRRNELSGARIDCAALARAIAMTIHPETDILRTYYYDCLPFQSNPPTQEEIDRFASKQRFFHALEQLSRFAVRLGRLKRIGPDQNGNYQFEQKMVDALLSIDLVHASLKGKITHVALVAGDSDFVPAIDVARSESVSVWLFHGSSMHRDLWSAADERVRLTDSFMSGILR